MQCLTFLDQGPISTTRKTVTRPTLFGRVQVTKKLELTPHVVHRDVGSESETGFGLGLVYGLKKKILHLPVMSHFQRRE